MRKYRSVAEWRALLAEQQSGGLNAKEYCRTKGIHANVFYRKKKLLGEGGGIVRLPVGMGNGATIDISIGGVTIGVRSGFAEEGLVRVLRCVREALAA